jgi:hypothetical protein
VAVSVNGSPPGPPTLIAIVIAMSLAAPAFARPADLRLRVADTAASIDRRLAEGRAKFEAQDYAAAIELLAPIARDARATRSQRLAALEQIALAHFIRRDLGAARTTFERILDIDPGYDLRDPSGSPALRKFFAELKHELVPGYDPGANADLEHGAPRGATAGRTAELDIKATRGGDRVLDVVVQTRRRGELGYRASVASPRGAERWRARIKPPPATKPYVLEYYVEARGTAGEPVGRIGSPDGPLELAIAAGEGDRPWYGRWYVIAGAAIVTGIAGAAVVVATRGPGDGSLPPGTITVTP